LPVETKLAVDATHNLNQSQRVYASDDNGYRSP
jgi:hypothetical protein